MKRIRTGLIGAGYGQHVIAPSLARCNRFHINSVATSGGQTAAKMAANLNVPKYFGDWRELLHTPDIEAVFIAVPPRLQPEIALSAISAGKAVWCEKLMAIDVETAQQMHDAAAISGVPNMVDFIFPEVPAWQRAKEIIDAGGVGIPRHIVVNWHVQTYANRYQLKSWKTQSAQGGGTLMNFTPHVFHYLEWLFGPIERMSAALFGKINEKVEGDLHDVLALQFGTGVSAGVSICTNAFKGDGHSLRVFGSKGTIILENQTEDPVFGFKLHFADKKEDKLETINLPKIETKNVNDGRIVAVTSLAMKFADWIEFGTLAQPNFSDCLRVQKLIHTALKSHESHGWNEVL